MKRETHRTSPVKELPHAPSVQGDASPADQRKVMLEVVQMLKEAIPASIEMQGPFASRPIIGGANGFSIQESANLLRTWAPQFFQEIQCYNHYKMILAAWRNLETRGEAICAMARRFSIRGGPAMCSNWKLIKPASKPEAEDFWPATKIVNGEDFKRFHLTVNSVARTLDKTSEKEIRRIPALHSKGRLAGRLAYWPDFLKYLGRQDSKEKDVRDLPHEGVLREAAQIRATRK